MRVEMPFPPTTNNLYLDGSKGRNRPKTEDYRAWIKEAGWLVNAQPTKPINGNYRTIIQLRAPDRRARGADNYLKAPLDLLVSLKLVDDDESSHRGGSYEWAELDQPGAIVTVTPA